MPWLRVDLTLSHCPFAPRCSQVRVKGFLQRSGGSFPGVVISTRAAQAGVRCKVFSGFAEHGSVLYGKLLSMLTLLPRVGGRGCVNLLMLSKVLVGGGILCGVLPGLTSRSRGTRLVGAFQSYGSHHGKRVALASLLARPLT